MRKIFFHFITAFLIAFFPLKAQNNNDKEIINIAPGIEYEAGWFHELIFGEHWRDLWITPINVEILDLRKFAGGLTPLKRGGGFQTKSLRLLGKDGNVWKFRSMAKDPAKVLPKILRQTVVADIFQDQISSANPLAALVAAPILDSVGILQAKPYLVYMPNDTLLGDFRNDFGGELGMIEIHPDVDEDEGREFEGADKVTSTFKLFKRLEEKANEKVDANNFLLARLVDIFLGDWDRHTDQWKWARFEQDSISYWEPIPRDRDQVFAKWDGLGPRVAAYLVPQFVHFDYEYPDVEDITWSGRYIDRRFLTEITESQWDSVTAVLVNKLTDNLITSAVKKLPIEHYEIASEELINKLKSRRNLLNSFSKEYYNMINKVVDLYGTDKNDIAEISRLNDKTTKVEIYTLTKKSNKRKNKFIKTFNNSITKDIRIYLLDGDDKAIVRGDVNSGPIVRVIGDGGKDSFIDSSLVRGYLFGILPISNAECKTEFFDSGKKTIIKKGSGTYFSDKKMPKPKDEYEKYEPAQRDRSVDWLPSPVLDFNTNDGLTFGIGAQLYSYNFRMTPYEYWVNLTGNYATRPQSLNFKFSGVFNSILRGSTLTLDLMRSELLFTNYYGFGNETVYDSELEEDEYYRVDEDLFSAGIAAHLNFFGKISGSFGINYKDSKLELNNSDLLTSFRSSYGLNSFKILKLFSNFKYDSRDKIYYTKQGMLINLNASIFPKLFDNEKTFFKTEIEASYYQSIESFTEFVLALKTGGGIVFGDYPFFESIFVGGSNSLRGYSRRRFAGDSGLYGQLELRTYLFPLKIIVPGKFGIHNFVETGRVFDEIYSNSDKWHPSYGGGIWLSFVDDAVSASFTLATSTETTSYYFSLGMGF